jgi:alpha-L-rhamnosidase
LGRPSPSKSGLSTGIHGTKYLLDLLPRFGRPDVAARIVSQRTFPGWGYMIDNGATTLWENWKKDDRTYSHNHPMFGSVSEYFMKHIAGIAPHPDAVGFDRVLLRPQPGDEVGWARGRYRSVRGEIVSAWRVRDGVFIWDITLPPGTSATAHVPVAPGGVATESGRALSFAPGVRRFDDGSNSRDAAGSARWVVVEIESGRYRFESRLAGVLGGGKRRR